MSEYQAGVIVDGRYRVISRIGTGGMADVYLAEDMQLSREVALKVLHRRFAEDAGFVERFRREAQSAAGLQHPNVVSVFDRGAFDGTYYIAMEYLDGRTLKQLILSEAPLDPDRAIELTIQILKAARFAHRRGVIHRDLKPHNVMVDSTDHVKVTDFGIARAGASDMTETGSIMGTAQYLSPEQAQGHPVSGPSDLYAVAVVLYELITGRVPFDGDSAVTIALKHVSEAPVPPSQINPRVPQPLEQVVLWALNKNASDRPANADEFIEALRHAQEAMHAPPTEATAMMRAVVPAAPAAEVMRLTPPPTAMLPAPVAIPEPADELVDTSANGGSDDDGHGWWPWLLALLVVLLLAGAAAAYLLTRPTKVRVPQLVGLQLKAAEAKLRADDLNWTTPKATYSTEPRNQVVAQSLAAGRRVNSGSTLTLTYSRGRAAVEVPTVAALTQAQAVAAIKKANLKIKKIVKQNSQTPIGNAIDTSPEAGTGVAAGSPVILYVSNGEPVPSVFEDTAAAARATLRGDGFNVIEFQRLGSGLPVGQVFKQSPTGGTLAAYQSTVTIYVAKKPPSTTAKVPPVVGYTKSGATSALTSAGFKVAYRTETVSASDESHQVIRQSPPGGSTAKKGSTVTIWIGKYKAPRTTSTASSTTTASTTTGTNTTANGANGK